MTGPARATAWMTPDGLSIADQIDLERIARHWETVYDIGYVDGQYRAFRLIGGPLITADTLAGIDSAVRADYWRLTQAAGRAS